MHVLAFRRLSLAMPLPANGLLEKS